MCAKKNIKNKKHRKRKKKPSSISGTEETLYAVSHKSLFCATLLKLTTLAQNIHAKLFLEVFRILMVVNQHQFRTLVYVNSEMKAAEEVKH